MTDIKVIYRFMEIASVNAWKGLASAIFPASEIELYEDMGYVLHNRYMEWSELIPVIKKIKDIVDRKDDVVLRFYYSRIIHFLTTTFDADIVVENVIGFINFYNALKKPNEV